MELSAWTALGIFSGSFVPVLLCFAPLSCSLTIPFYHLCQPAGSILHPRHSSERTVADAVARRLDPCGHVDLASRTSGRDALDLALQQPAAADMMIDLCQIRQQRAGAPAGLC